MTHNELLVKLEEWQDQFAARHYPPFEALRAVVKLHKPMWDNEYCAECHPDHNGSYPCPTIQAIEKELK